MLKVRKAKFDDLDMYYEWANDPLVREFSYSTGLIDYKSHVEWFKKVINDDNFLLYVFSDEKGDSVGQVRIEIGKDKVAIIGISVAKMHRGRGLSSNMIIMASNYFFEQYPDYKLCAYIIKKNQSSYHSFLKAGFILNGEILVHQKDSFLLLKAKNNIHEY